MLKRIVSVKKYIKIIIFLVIIYCIYSWFVMYIDKRDFIADYIQGIKYDDLDDYIIENNNTTIYVYSSNVIYNSDYQKYLTNIIVKNNLQNKLTYLDIKDYLNNGEYNIKNVSFNSVPLLITFNNGKIISSYDIKKYNYNIDKIESYLESVGVIRND